MMECSLAEQVYISCLLDGEDDHTSKDVIPLEIEASLDLGDDWARFDVEMETPVSSGASSPERHCSLDELSLDIKSLGHIGTLGDLGELEDIDAPNLEAFHIDTLVAEPSLLARRSVTTGSLAQLELGLEDVTTSVTSLTSDGMWQLLSPLGLDEDFTPAPSTCTSPSLLSAAELASSTSSFVEPSKFFPSIDSISSALKSPSGDGLHLLAPPMLTPATSPSAILPSAVTKSFSAPMLMEEEEEEIDVVSFNDAAPVAAVQPVTVAPVAPLETPVTAEEIAIIGPLTAIQPALSSETALTVAVPSLKRDIDLEEDVPMSPVPKRTRRSLMAELRTVTPGVSLDNEEEKRNIHNVLERKRRNDLKSSFVTLKDSVPELIDNDRAPKVLILKKAADYIRALRKEDDEFEKVKRLLQEENTRLQEQLRAIAV